MDIVEAHAASSSPTKRRKVETSKDENKIPPAFQNHFNPQNCMIDPVSTQAYGAPKDYTFEREDISEWIRVKGTCPCTGEQLSLADLHANHGLW